MTAAPNHETPAALRILLVEQDKRAYTALETGLPRLLAARKQSLLLEQVGTLSLLRHALNHKTWDAVFCCDNDTELPFPIVQRITQELGLDLPMMLLVSNNKESAKAAAMKVGAPDGFHLDQLDKLLPALDREIRDAERRSNHHAALNMLRESEQRFRALAGNLPGMVFEMTRDGTGTLRFLYVSEGGQKLLGLPTHQLLSSFASFTDTIDPEDRASLGKALADSAASLSPLQWEGRIRARNQQRPKWINLRSMPQRKPDWSIHWHGIATDISHSKDIEAALRQSREQLAELSNYLESAKEEERERIAHDIHDELGSILTAAKIEAALLTNKLPEQPINLRSKALSLEDLLNQAMGTASRVARELRPGILKEFGLQAAIECQAEDFAQLTGITCHVQCDELGSDFDDRVSLALFRIAQEALTNVAKHSHASLVVLRLQREGRHLVLEVRDNGRGITKQDVTKPRSFGLRGIRERCRSLNGKFRVEPGEQGGTHLWIRIPAKPPLVGTDGEDLQQSLF